MTTQEINRKMEETLSKCGLPYLEIKCYGRQITVETKGRSTAERWARIIGQFATVRGMIQTVAYNKENRGTCLRPTMYKIWRVYGAIQ